MNIFASYPCPIESARFLDPRRANKMIVESFQLMSNAMWKNGSIGYYKQTHLNHPCSIWTAESRANYQWLLRHAQELLRLYTLRYKRTHKCEEHLVATKEFLTHSFALDYRTPFVNCTTFKEVSDVHEAYQLHLMRKWGMIEKL